MEPNQVCSTRFSVKWITDMSSNNKRWIRCAEREQKKERKTHAKTAIQLLLFFSLHSLVSSFLFCRCLFFYLCLIYLIYQCALSHSLHGPRSHVCVISHTPIHMCMWFWVVFRFKITLVVFSFLLLLSFSVSLSLCAPCVARCFDESYFYVCPNEHTFACSILLSFFPRCCCCPVFYLFIFSVSLHRHYHFQCLGIMMKPYVSVVSFFLFLLSDTEIFGSVCATFSQLSTENSIRCVLCNTIPSWM